MSRILICSAEESIRESLKLILGENNNLILCENIEYCPELIKNSCDVETILLDVAQQDNVQKVVESIKSNNPSINIVAACRHKQTDLAQDIVKSGADGYILIPFKSDEILSVCNKKSSKSISN